MSDSGHLSVIVPTVIDSGLVGPLVRSREERRVKPKPYTLHPTLHTLHLTPYTLHPAPNTLHPTPYTLHPTRDTLHITPYTLHPAVTRASPFQVFVDMAAGDDKAMENYWKGKASGLVSLIDLVRTDLSKAVTPSSLDPGP